MVLKMNDSMPRISIAMATYNGEEYLREQLDSILNQSLSDFEFIICDDCSKDDTWQILEEYARQDERIRIFCNDTNLGFKKNFEKVISICNGEYVALADQDDIWEKNHLSVLLSNIGKNYLACGNALCFEEQNSVKIYKYSLFELDNNITSLSNNLDILKSILFKGNPFQGASMLLSRKFLDLALPIPNSIPFHDVWFALLACCYNSILYVDVVINNYRQHEKSVTKRSKESIFRKILKLPKFSNILKYRDIYPHELLMKKHDYKQDVLEIIDFTSKFCLKMNNRFYRWQQYKYFKKNIFPVIYRKLTGFPLFARKIQYLFF